MTAIFVSDVHLRDGASVKSKLFIRFLQEVAAQFKRIYILGDLFDVWPGTNSFLVRNYESVLEVLKSLVNDGHELHYLEGNHDFRLGDYFTDKLGIRVYPDAIIEEWNGKRIFMAHGDMGNPHDMGYRALRYVLRHDWLQKAMHFLPEDFVYNVGAKSSQLSRQYQKKAHRNDAKIRQIYRKAAENIFSNGYDVVIMGHTHIPDDVNSIVDGRSCRYINTGDWVSHFTYLEFDGTQFYTRTHPVKSL
jgi:UDP-2,3-diacylglucosamine hydrolase